MKKYLLAFFTFCFITFSNLTFAAFTLGDGTGSDSCSDGGFQYHDRNGCVTGTACNKYAGPSGQPDPKDYICIYNGYSSINGLTTPDNSTCSFTSAGRSCTCNVGYTQFNNGYTTTCVAPSQLSCPSGYIAYDNGTQTTCQPQKSTYCSYGHVNPQTCDYTCPSDKPVALRDGNYQSCLSNISENDCTYGANTKYPHQPSYTCANPPLTTCESISSVIGMSLNCAKADNNGTCEGQRIDVLTSHGTICGTGAGGIAPPASANNPLQVTVLSGSPPIPTSDTIPDANSTPDITCYQGLCVGDDEFTKYSGPDVSTADYEYSYQDTNGNLLNCDSTWQNCYILNNDGSHVDLKIDGSGNLTTIHHTPDNVVSTINDYQNDGIYQNTNASNPVKPNNTGFDGSYTNGSAGSGGGDTGGGTGGGDTGGGTGGGDTGGGTGGGDTGGGTGGGDTGGGTGGGDTDGDGDTVSWSAPGYPDVPDTFYQTSYPDGLSGIWDSAMQKFEATGINELIEGLTPNINGGQCPTWSMDFTIGSMIDMGLIDFVDICWLWFAIKIIFIITALFTARALIFGG